MLQHKLDLVNECLTLVAQGQQARLFQQQERVVGSDRRCLVDQAQAPRRIPACHVGFCGENQYVWVLVVDGDESVCQQYRLPTMAPVQQTVPVLDAGQQHWIDRWQGHRWFAGSAGDPPHEGSPVGAVDQKSLVKFMK